MWGMAAGHLEEGGAVGGRLPLCMFYRDIKMIEPYAFKCLHKILKETWIDKRN